MRPPSLVVYRLDSAFERVLLDEAEREIDVIAALDADDSVVRVVREDPPRDGYGLVPTATWERSHGRLRRREYRTGRLMIDVDRDELAGVCRRHGIVHLAVFGSAITDDFDPASSDVDVLVDFDPDRRMSLLDVGGARSDLAAVFGGRHVDIVEFEQARRSMLIGHAVDDAVDIVGGERVGA